MKELRIPYGIDRSTRMIIEPEDAISGRACNCLCPGCESPLVSRHPVLHDRRIHFAHDSRHPDSKPLDECPLSPFVALGMMLRHISASLAGKIINLTAYYKPIYLDCCSSTRRFLNITEDEKLLISECEQSPNLGGVIYDLKLIINKKSYFVDLIYPGKNRKELPAQAYLRDIGGIFCVSGPEFIEMMAIEEYKTTRYSDSVSQFFLNHSQKFWCFHYQEPKCEEELRQNHKCKPLMTAYGPKRQRHYGGHSPAVINQSPPNAAEAYRKASRGEANTFPPVKTKTVGNVATGQPGYDHSYGYPLTAMETNNNGNESIKSDKFECLFCDLEFKSYNHSPPTCPRCKRHLGVRPK